MGWEEEGGGVRQMFLAGFLRGFEAKVTAAMRGVSCKAGGSEVGGAGW